MEEIVQSINEVVGEKLSAEKRIVPSFNVAWHYHNKLELVYITQSNGIRLVGDNVSPFFPGDLVLVGSLLPHLWRSDSSYYNIEKPEDFKEIKTIVIKFNENFLGDNFFKNYEFQKIKKLFEDSKFGLFFNKTISTRLHHKIVNLPSLTKTEQYVGLLDILCQLSMIDNKDRVVLSSSDMRQSTTENSDRIDVVLRYISDNYSSKITLSEIANIACMTTNSFCRFFKKATNKSFTQFLNEIRIRNASRILIQQKILISEVCYSVGFNSVTNFNKQFKQIMGVTPKKFRDKIL